MNPFTRTRVLPPAEWARLQTFPPFDRVGLPNPDHWRILVAERAGAIVGFCCLFDAVHWEAWYVIPELRGNPAIIHGLIQTGVQELREAEVEGVFAMIDETQTGAIRSMIERFGFQPAPGRLYLADLDRLKGV